MHDSVQINLPLDRSIQNDSRMYPGRIANFQCGECSFPSDTQNIRMLQLNLNPNQNQINSPYIPFHHEYSRWFKKRPLEHSNQIMYIKQFLRTFYYCFFEQQFLSSAVCVDCLQSSRRIPTHFPLIKVKISFNIVSLWETIQSLLLFCKFTPMIRSLAPNLAFRSYVVH